MENLKSAENELMDKVLKVLGQNGFPQKKVSLPLEKMYQAADDKGLSFNKIRERFKAEKSIMTLLDGEKVIFFKKEEVPPQFQDTDFSFLEGLDLTSLKGMSPQEQMAEITKNLTPEKMAAIQKMLGNMSTEEKESLMKKGKEMGLI